MDETRKPSSFPPADEAPPPPLDASQQVHAFFDALASEYTDEIERCVPRYREMLEMLLAYLPASLDEPLGAGAERTILELGCGTGNLSALLAQKYPHARLHLVDVSQESLAGCRDRLGGGGRVDFHCCDFRDLSADEARLKPDSLDVVVSSIALHHLASDEKRELFRNIFGWLKPGGWLAYADQFAGAWPEVYEKHLRGWRKFSDEAGGGAEQWAMWMRHQADHDHHDTLFDQIQWLREAGFETVDCTWRHLLWTVLQTQKVAR